MQRRGDWLDLTLPLTLGSDSHVGWRVLLNVKGHRKRSGNIVIYVAKVARVRTANPNSARNISEAENMATHAVFVFLPTSCSFMLHQGTRGACTLANRMLMIQWGLVAGQDEHRRCDNPKKRVGMVSLRADLDMTVSGTNESTAQIMRRTAYLPRLTTTWLANSSATGEFDFAGTHCRVVRPARRR